MTSRRAFLCAGLGVALVLGALLVWTPSSIDEIASEHGVVAASQPNQAEPEERTDLDELVLASASEPRRTETERASEAERPAANDAQQSPSSYGLVLDLEGQPVPGVAVAHRHDPKSPFATSSGDGSFSLAEPEIELVVVDPRWSTLRDTEPLERNGRRVTLVLVAPAIRIGGRVQDATGVGIEGAQIEFDVPATSFASFPEPLDRARGPRTSNATTKSDGAFELVIPSVPRANLNASRDGFDGVTIAAPSAEQLDLTLILTARGRAHVTKVNGVVLHPDGTPAVSATVRFDDISTASDSEGRFVLTIESWPSDPLPLVAVKRGFQAAVLPNFAVTFASSSAALREQRLVLGPPPLAIEGRVVDHEGRPKKGWIVQPVDPELIRDGHIPPESVEALALGDPVRATSDDDGSFRLVGLQDRAYRLQAHSPEELVRIESEPIAAGSRNVRIVVPANARIAKVEGVVVAHDGTPIRGVRVRAALIVFRVRWGHTTEHAEGVMTDADGRFTLVNVPRERSQIDVDGDFVLPVSHELEAHVDGDIRRITAARRCHLRVEGVPPSAGFDEVEVLDAQGTSLHIVQFQSGGMMTSPRAPIVDGASAVFAVAETARTIVFHGGGQPGVSRALVLHPGQITVVAW